MFWITLCVLFWVSITIHSDLSSITIWFLLSQCSYAIQVSLWIFIFPLFFVLVFYIELFKAFTIDYFNTMFSFFNAYFPFPVSLQYNCFINKLISFCLLSSFIMLFKPTSVLQYNSIENKNWIMIKWFFLVYKFENFVIF